MKLTKQQARLHAQAEALLGQDVLSRDDKLFVLEHWREDANHVNSTAGAFFTPWQLALDFALDAIGGGGRPLTSLRIIDLCAGIGTLSLACQARHEWDECNGAPPLDITCVEVNPAYAAVGRKMLPEARWIEASIFDLPDLGRFDIAISNPPFGRIKRDGDAPRYRGGEFEYHVIDIAGQLAATGAFILPATSAGFTLSGRAGGYQEIRSAKLEAFAAQTGIELEAGCGIDTAYEGYGSWHGVTPHVEIVTCDFPAAPVVALPEGKPTVPHNPGDYDGDLFGGAA